MKKHYFYVVYLLINCILTKLRNIEYQFNTKYSNNTITMLN